MTVAQIKSRQSVARPLRRNADATRRQIFEAALTEFSQFGYSGARMDRIAAKARCNIRMIYHHFGNKEELYQTVLKSSYADIREKEQLLQIEKLSPIDGLVRLLEFTFDHFAQNPKFIALLTNENLMRGRFVLKSKRITQMTSPLRTAIETLVQRGREEGALPSDVDPVQLYATIAAMSWFHLSNAFTLSAMFGRDLTNSKWRRRRRAHVRDVLVGYLALRASSMKPSDK